MPIRRRAAVSNPQAHHEDKFIRIALRAGLEETQRDRAEAVRFGEKITDAQHMKWDRAIAWYRRMLSLDGLLTLVPKSSDC